MSDSVLYDVTDAVATVTLNRPDSLNSLDVEAKEGLREAFERASADTAVRAVVFTGTGRAFCVGQDLAQHAELIKAGDPGPLRTVVDHYNPMVHALATMPKPVIAAVNGVAAGAGASLAYVCDFRIAADTASFLMAFANVGLGADSGASWTLPRLVGHARATELLMLAEKVPASRALEIGLVNRVVPADTLADEVAALARRLAAGPTTAYAVIKKALAVSSESSLQQQLDLEADLQGQAGATEDHKSATLAFLAKQPVSFTGR